MCVFAVVPMCLCRSARQRVGCRGAASPPRSVAPLTRHWASPLLGRRKKHSEAELIFRGLIYV